MEEILRVIIKNLVENKEAISIESENKNENTIVFKVKVAKNEMGKVIGKQGKVAYSIRNIMKAAASREGKKVEVEFVDD